METENKMITLTTIFVSVLIGFFVVGSVQILSRLWHGYPVTVEDIISDMVLLVCIMVLIYFLYQ